MDADFSDMLKSHVADFKNVPPNRYGGAIAGGKFLEQFVAGIPPPGVPRKSALAFFLTSSSLFSGIGALLCAYGGID